MRQSAPRSQADSSGSRSAAGWRLGARLTATGAGETIAGIADAPSSGRSRRALLAGAALVGAAVVGLAWLFLGNSGNSGVSSSLASLGQAPGIAPPDYAYLDNARVALYLGQLEGGIAKSEQLTQQLTQGRSAGVSAGGLSLGGSTGSQSTAERVVTPTATARFYQLLDLLGRDGYLHTINAGATPSQLRRAFAGISEGSFVKLTGCTLRLPSYVRIEQISRASKGTEYPVSILFAALQSAPGASGSAEAYNEISAAKKLAGRVKGIAVGGAGDIYERPATARRLGRAIRSLDRTVGTDPRVPLSTCNGKTDYHLRGVDLLFPIRLANLSSEQSLLAGPVTLVGKLIRAVRKPGQEYVDDASFATFSGPIEKIDATQPGGDTGLYEELNADAVVLAPGAVILPLAIYK